MQENYDSVGFLKNREAAHPPRIKPRDEKPSLFKWQPAVGWLEISMHTCHLEEYLEVWIRPCLYSWELFLCRLKGSTPFLDT